MKLNFRQDVLVLPATVLSCCETADAVSMRVLLWLASDLSLAQKPRQLAKLAGCKEKELRDVLDFWTEQGVLCADSLQDDSVAVMATPAAAPTGAQEPKTEKRTLVRRADTLPTYTSTELADMIEKRQGMRELIDEAQQILGKMFNPAEVNILVGMVDYLGMDEDCILLLLAHCKNLGKTNLRAIEKYAYSLVDVGVTDSAALEERIHHLEMMHTFEGEVRALFGMKSRALSAKEKRMLAAWNEHGYDIEIVKRAYEITVNATNEASPAYANAILERWYSEGLLTAEAIDARLAQEAAKKGDGEVGFGNSFDTDDFFEAAIRRSFGDSNPKK